MTYREPYTPYCGLTYNDHNRPVRADSAPTRTHIVTNKHVVTALAHGSNLSVYPSTGDDGGEQVKCECVAHPHPELDVALIEVRAPAGKGMPRVAGMAFRDPAWADVVYLFGYPHVPMVAGMVLTVQRGEVVNPG